MATFVKKYPAISMFILAFVIGTGITMLVLNGVLPESLYLLAAASASVAGLILTAIVAGRAGIRDLFRRILIWRVGGRWWAFALFMIPGVVILGMVINAVFGLDPLDLSGIPQGLLMVVPIMTMTTITGGLNEELGWRGYLLPRLQGRYNALVAGLIVGVFHGFWHIPLFFIDGLSPYQEIVGYMGLIPAIVGYALIYVLPWSILYTCLLNNTKGSLLLMAIHHGSQAWVLALWNASNPKSFIGLSAAMTIIAIVIVLIFGPENLSKTSERYVIEDA
ncbi:CPBP family intramembrane glutamic endopeptidase [Chloroflexota bacterium]